MAGPLRVERDVEVGRWLQRALRDDASVALVVPPIFPAYARILHPATLRTPTGATDAWGDPEHVERDLSWAEAAELIGDRLGEPRPWTAWLRRFGEVGHDLPGGGRHIEGHTLPDGGRIEEPGVEIPLPILAALTELVLDEHGDRDVLAAVWEGRELDVHRPGATFGWFEGAGPVRRWLEGRRLQREHARSVRASIDPEVTAAMDAGDVLGLPREQQGRGHVLLRGALSTFADPTWVESAGLGWRADRPGSGRLPNALWPAEPHAAPAWMIATELDADVTLVGGSGQLIGRILGHPALEAERVRDTDPLFVPAVPGDVEQSEP